MTAVKRLTTPLALMMTISALSTQVLAYEAGDFIVRAGATTVAPNESSSNVMLNRTTNLGTKASVSSSTQLGLTFEYMLTAQWGVEVLAATPFRHNLKGQGGALANTDIGSVKQLPPTLSMMYHFPTEGDFDPYLGAGINYTAFFSEDLASGTANAVSTGSLKLDNSWGVALQAGFDYQLNDKWLLNSSVRYMDIDTKGTIDFDSGSVANVNVDIDPWVYSIMIGYKF
ncbi:MAG: outer membrane protein [Oceanospirillaceae bacterium]|jgi:outer membrane protein